MSLLRAARGGVIEELNVDWGLQDPPSKKEENAFDDDFEMISDETASIKTAVEPSAPAPISLFDTSAPSTSEDLGPKKMVINLAPPPRIQQAPKSDKLPIPLYPGFRCSIFSIIKVSGQTSFSSCVRIHGKVMGSPVTLEIPVTPIALEGGAATHLTDVKAKLLHSLAARALIQDWEDKEKTEKNRAEIERLGKRYSLASSATSFLAIDGETKEEMEKEGGHYQEEERERARERSPTTRRSKATKVGSASFSPAHGAIHIASLGAAPRPSGGPPGMMGGTSRSSRQSDTMAAPPALMTMGGLRSYAHHAQARSSAPPPPTPAGAAVPYDADEQVFSAASVHRFHTVSPQADRSSTPMSGYAYGSSSLSKASAAAPPSPSGGAGESRGGGFLKKLVSRSSTTSASASAPTSAPAPAPRPMQQMQRMRGPVGSSTGSMRYADTQDTTIDWSGAAGYGGEEYSTRSSRVSAQTLSNALPTPTPVPASASYGGGTLTVESIARAQQFDGSFPVSGDFIHLLTRTSSTPALPGELAALSGSEQAKQTIWVTVIVLAVLAKKFGKDKDSWEMLAEKSSEFVETSLVSMGVDGGNAATVIKQLKTAAARNV